LKESLGAAEEFSESHLRRMRLGCCSNINSGEPLIAPVPNNKSFLVGILISQELFMKKLHSAFALAILSTSLMGGIALAQDHHDNHAYVEHKEWKRGAMIKHEDWERADKVDYHQYHLAAPPAGYEWRMVDGSYVLVNASTFQIRTVVRVQ
jgi:Ni/Co efflux regulator RcnB